MRGLLRRRDVATICPSMPQPPTNPLQLDPTRIIATIATLQNRISERFPDSGLSRIAGSLKSIAAAAHQRARAMRGPNVLLRLAVGVVLAGVAALLAFIIGKLRFTDAAAWEMLEGIDAAIGSIIFLGAAALFLITLESRLKRKKVLAAVEELRELAHIIDMHQLTKDPERISGHHQPTASSPKMQLTPFLLGRYLDYCSEMLSLIGKVAVIYTQGASDAVVLEAIDNIETLTTGLSRKIWQKLMILDRVVEGK